MKKEIIPFNIEDNIGFLTAKATAHLKINFIRKLKALNYNITPEQFGILYTLNETNGLYQKQIADKIFKDKPNVTRMLDILEKSELIIRKSDENDRRKFKIYITDKGIALTGEIIPILIENRKLLRQIISEEEEILLKKILTKINTALEEYDPKCKA